MIRASLLCLGCQAFASPPGPPLQVAAPATAEPEVVSLRVVDEATGEPLPGAQVSLVDEHPCPEPAAWWETRRVAADKEGWARVRRVEAEQPEWWFFQAEGYAPRALPAGGLEPVVGLAPGVRVEVEVRDWLERPRPGVRLDLVLGCGHDPAVRSAVTDESGRAVFQDVQPGEGELWPVAPGVRSDWLPGWSPDWRPGDPPLVLRVQPGQLVCGSVVDRAGAPVAGVCVGAPERHRGPWTRTDDQGRFVLTVGAIPELTVRRERAEKPLGWFPVPLTPAPALLAVPNVDEDRSRRSDLRVVVETVHGERPPGLPVRAMRTEPHLSGASAELQGGEALLALREGRYRVVVGGPFHSHTVEATVEVPVTARIHLVAPSNPSFRLRAPVDGETRVWLVTDDAAHEVTDEVATGKPIHVLTPASSGRA